MKSLIEQLDEFFATTESGAVQLPESLVEQLVENAADVIPAIETRLAVSVKERTGRRVQLVAARLLARLAIQQPAAVAILVATLLRSGPTPGRQFGAKQAVLFALTETHVREAIPALVGATDDLHSSIRVIAAKALVAYGRDAVPVLTKSLAAKIAAHEPTHHITRILGRVGADAEDAVPTLILGLQECVKHERLEMASALGYIGGSSARLAIPVLLDLLIDDCGPGSWLIADTIRRLGGCVETSVATLVPHLVSDDPEMRRSAGDAIEHLGCGAQAAAVSALRCYADDVRVRALDAIKSSSRVAFIVGDDNEGTNVVHYISVTSAPFSGKCVSSQEVLGDFDVSFERELGLLTKYTYVHSSRQIIHDCSFRPSSTDTRVLSSDLTDCFLVSGFRPAKSKHLKCQLRLKSNSTLPYSSVANVSECGDGGGAVRDTLRNGVWYPMLCFGNDVYVGCGVFRLVKEDVHTTWTAELNVVVLEEEWDLEDSLEVRWNGAHCRNDHRDRKRERRELVAEELSAAANTLKKTPLQDHGLLGHSRSVGND